ncbi:MAG: septum formation inhibitor Maf [Actinobacteria bacterium]|nr:MAG: septum formation inhibitor Maf [Actinomycetota bacterium]
MRLILASASAGRLGVLRAAGIDPVVHVSEVDEDALAATLAGATPAELVTALASAKAEAVATKIVGEYPDAVIVGCDSMLHIGGELVGKPGYAEAVVRRWQAMAGRTGELLTGHAVVRLERGIRIASTSGVQTTVIRFGSPSPEEIEAYVNSAEPLHVAGGFTLDGRGGWFVEGIDGDPSSVIGISLPLTRRLLSELGTAVVSLWS